MQIKSIAIAIAALGAMASASAATITVNAAGSSAARGVITGVIVETVCGAAGSTTVYHNGSNVTRIVCPVSATAGVFSASDTLDFSYDNTSGSYLGAGPVSGNGQLTARVNTASCTTTTTEVISGKTVASKTGCGNEATLVRPAIGNLDVEVEMFQGANIGSLPAPILTGISATSSQFGIIFGVVVSEKLYRDLQADQGLNTAAALTDEANAPSLSRAQIASLATANGGPLNTNWVPLFKNAAPSLATSRVQFVRRVAGSGTQTSFNATFLGYLCSLRGATPAGASDTIPGQYIVNEQSSTGNLLAAVNSTTAYNIGIASRENVPSGATSNWGHIKIDGTYPSKANVIAGRYNWMAEQTLTLKASPSANEQAMFDRLVTLTASPTVINGFSAAARDGSVALPFVADAGDPNYATHATHYRTFGNSCVVPTAAE